MDLEGIRSFLAVAKYRSISKAAASLYVTQPAMSLRLRRLEDGLGFPLFKRGWHGAELTQQGSYFLPYAAQLVRDLASASEVLGEDVQAKPRSFMEVVHGQNKISIGVDTWITEQVTQAIIDVFHEAAGADSFQIITRPAPTLIDLLDLTRLDYAVFYSIQEQYTFQTQTLLQDRMVLVHRTDSDLRKGTSADIRRALSENPFVLFDNPILTHHAGITSQIIEKYELSRFHIVDDYHVMLSLIRTGSAISIVPFSSIHQHLHRNGEEISITEIDESIPRVAIDLGYHSASRGVEKAEAFHTALSRAMVPHRSAPGGS